MSDNRVSTTIKIFGHEYRVKGDADPGYIEEVARYVDQKMREVSKQTPVGSITKIAILAALNIADELFRERNEKEKIISSVDAVTDRMRRKLEEIFP